MRPKLTRISLISGATHGTNLVSLLGNPMIMQIARRLATADEKQISSLFRKIIINFIKHGFVLSI